MITADKPLRKRTSRAGVGAESTGAKINVSDAERMASLLGGSVLGLFGLSRGSLAGLALAALGGGLVYRGWTGHCDLYATLGVRTAPHRGPATSVPAHQGIRLEKGVFIHRSPAEVYEFWRNLQNLPRFMSHLQSVHNLGNLRSHWVAKAPFGLSVQWDAEIIQDHPNELIAWRSLPGSDVDSAGSVHFQTLRGGRGTEVRVVLKYDPPAGRFGAAMAMLFGEDPDQTMQEDLRHFKHLLEAGQFPTT